MLPLLERAEVSVVVGVKLVHNFIPQLQVLFARQQRREILLA